MPAHAHYFADCNTFYDPVNRGIHFGDSDLGPCCSRRFDLNFDTWVSLGDVLLLIYYFNSYCRP